MNSLDNYTTYCPDQPINNQLKRISEPRVYQNSAFGVPFEMGKVSFVPLKVNDKVLELTLQFKSDIDESDPNEIAIVRKYTFQVKSQGTDDIHLTDIPANDIDKFIKEIFTSSTNSQNNT